jgi:hypothetical protein
MIEVRYIIQGHDEDYFKTGSLPFIPQDFDTTTSIFIGSLQFYAVDATLRDGNAAVDMSVMLYTNDDGLSDDFLEIMKKEGWQVLKEGA